MGILKTLTINGTTYSVTPVVPASSVTLLASAWVGDGESYSQVVAIPEVTAHTKIDLQPTSDQLAEFHYKVLSFVAENNGGVVTVYAIGDKPTGDHTIQITKTEVQGTGKIRGNTVGTSMPRPDWNQTDPTKADYIKNKPDLSGGGSGGGSGGTASNAVLYTEQTLTDDQKKQARKNINAVGKGEAINMDGKMIYNISDLRLAQEDGDSIKLFVEDNGLLSFSSVYNSHVVLRGIATGKQDTDAVNVAQLNEAVGPIESALDSIIAIQNGLIGVIAFLIDNVIYTAPVGMTWGEWCESEYNTIGAYVDGNNVRIENGYVAVYDPEIGDIDQLSNTVIIDKCNYYTY